MFVLIASDCPGISTKVRKALALNGHECPITHVVGLEQILSVLQSETHRIDVLVVVLPADEPPALALIRRLRSLTGAQLVAVGSARNSKHILEALHAGADDYLDEDGELKEQVHAALERMEFRADSASSGALVAVTSASGGSGASMVAANLAVKLAQQAQACALLELASGFGDLAALLNLNPRYTIADLLRHQEPIDSAMLEQSLIAHFSGVRLLAAPAYNDDVDLTDAHAIGRILSLCRGLYPCSVLDLDCRFRHNSELLKAVHCIVLVLRLDFTSLCNSRRLLDFWKEQQLDMGRVVLVANRVGQCGEVPLDHAQSLLGKEVAVQIHEDVAHANLAVNCGNPVVIESIKSPVSRAIGQLVNFLPGGAASRDRAGHGGPQQAAARNGSGIVKRVAGMLFC